VEGGVWSSLQMPWGSEVLLVGSPWLHWSPVSFPASLQPEWKA
jgi:hypothetical protein